MAKQFRKEGSWRWIQHLLWNLKMTSGCTLHLDYIRIHQPKMIKMVSRWMIHLSDFVDVYRTHEIIGSLQYLSLTFHQKIGICLSSTISKDRPNCHRKTLGPGVPRGKWLSPFSGASPSSRKRWIVRIWTPMPLTRSWMFRSGRWSGGSGGATWVGLPMLPGWGLESTYLKERFKWNCWPIFLCKFWLAESLLQIHFSFSGFYWNVRCCCRISVSSTKGIYLTEEYTSGNKNLASRIDFWCIFMSGVLPGI